VKASGFLAIIYSFA